jgi:CubicO group peptidase (beta-lactamase class C family)
MRALATAVATVAVALLLAAGSARDGRGQSITTLPDSVLPRKDDKTWLPDEWLLGGGQPWHHRVAARPPGAPLGTPAPTSQKAAAVQEVRHLVERYELKVVALVDDGRVIEIAARPGISLSTLLMSASMGKTVTAVAAGKAVCAGLLRLDTTAGSLVPALAGSDLGKATLRDLLTMTSGVVEPPPRNATGLTRDETARYIEGDGRLEELLASPRHAAAQRDGGGIAERGRRFSYKSVDPLAVAAMLQAATGRPTVRWIEDEVLRAVPIADGAVLGTNRRGEFVGAEGNVRLSLADWIRFAAWVQVRRGEAGCFGDWLRAMGSSQGRIPLIDGINGYFGGYGYFTWTDNGLVPQTSWAAGYGGQRIGWSSDPANRRIFITFGNSADKDMNAIYPVANRWINRVGR